MDIQSYIVQGTDYLLDLPVKVQSGDLFAIMVALIIIYCIVVLLKKFTRLVAPGAKKIFIFLIIVIAAYIFFQSFLLRILTEGRTRNRSPGPCFLSAALSVSRRIQRKCNERIFTTDPAGGNTAVGHPLPEPDQRQLRRDGYHLPDNRGVRYIFIENHRSRLFGDGILFLHHLYGCRIHIHQTHISRLPEGAQAFRSRNSARIHTVDYPRPFLGRSPAGHPALDGLLWVRRTRCTHYRNSTKSIHVEQGIKEKNQTLHHFFEYNFCIKKTIQQSWRPLPVSRACRERTILRQGPRAGAGGARGRLRKTRDSKELKKSDPLNNPQKLRTCAVIPETAYSNLVAGEIYRGLYPFNFPDIPVANRNMR